VSLIGFKRPRVSRLASTWEVPLAIDADVAGLDTSYHGVYHGSGDESIVE
jgi:hypothetical protein